MITSSSTVWSCFHRPPTVWRPCPWRRQYRQGSEWHRAAACNPLRDTIAKFRPAYEQHMKSLHFAPGFDMDAELSQARLATGRDDSGAHLETLA